MTQLQSVLASSQNPDEIEPKASDGNSRLRKHVDKHLPFIRIDDGPDIINHASPRISGSPVICDQLSATAPADGNRYRLSSSKACSYDLFSAQPWTDSCSHYELLGKCSSSIAVVIRRGLMLIECDPLAHIHQATIRI
jgi:hypothetical protein